MTKTPQRIHPPAPAGYLRLADIPPRHNVSRRTVTALRAAGVFPTAHYPGTPRRPHFLTAEVDAYFQANPNGQRGRSVTARLKPWTKITEQAETE